MIRRNEKFFSNAGSPYRTVYSPKVDQNGNIELVESGVENTAEFINSFKESTDISVILARVAAGDMSALNQRNGIFGDFTGMPKTYAEFLQLQIDSNNLFNSLPVEVRDKFGNDPNKFLAESGSKEWVEKLGDVLPENAREYFNPAPVDVPDDPVEEVKE